MWTRGGQFKEKVQNCLAQVRHDFHLVALKTVLYSLRHPLKLMSKHKYTDIYTQQVRARDALSQIQAQLQQDPCNLDLLHQEETTRNLYVEINQSALSLFKQQSKAGWIAYGDECSRLFMEKNQAKEGNDNHLHY